MARFAICPKTGLRRGAWTPEKDRVLATYIARHGHWNWRLLPKQAGLLRDGKSCRLRWMNYLRPDLKKGKFTKEEEDVIIKMHEKFGNRWSVIALSLPGRTDNEIKNHWHTQLKKRNLAVEETNMSSAETSIVTPLDMGRKPVAPLACSDFPWLFEMISPNNQMVEDEGILDLDGDFWEDLLPQQNAILVEPSSGDFFNHQLEEALSPYEVCNYNEIEMSSSTSFFSVGTLDEFVRFGCDFYRS